MAQSCSVTGSDEIELEVRYCVDHTNQEIRMYCSDHKCFGCGECMLFHHKSCNHEYITKAAEEFEDSGELARFLEDIKELEATREACNASLTTAAERINQRVKDLGRIELDIKTINSGLKPEDNIYKRFMLVVNMGPKITKIRETLQSIQCDATMEESDENRKGLYSVSASLGNLTVNTPRLKGKTNTNATTSQTLIRCKTKTQQPITASNKTMFTQPKSDKVATPQQSNDPQQKDDDLVYEIFYDRSGKEYQCIYQSGMRFYLDDWGSKEWQPFPKRWYNEGLLVTNTILKNDNDAYKFTTRHIKEQDNISDCLSCLLNASGRGDESTYVYTLSDQYVKFVAVNATPCAVTTRDIEKASRYDAEIASLRECIATNAWHKLEYTEYLPIRHE